MDHHEQATRLLRRRLRRGGRLRSAHGRAGRHPGHARRPARPRPPARLRPGLGNHRRLARLGPSPGPPAGAHRPPPPRRRHHPAAATPRDPSGPGPGRAPRRRGRRLEPGRLPARHRPGRAAPGRGSDAPTAGRRLRHRRGRPEFRRRSRRRRRPAIILAQRRPFGEQAATARVLDDARLAACPVAFPEPGDWEELIALARQRAGNWELWQTRGAADRAARIIEEVAQ